MVYNRKPNRLREYDYSLPGWYFVTICVNRFDPVFGAVVKETAYLSPIGRIVERCWLAISVHFPNVILDEYAVMPNHIHGILAIQNIGNNDYANIVGNSDRCSLQVKKNRNVELLPRVVSQFKSSVSREIKRRYPGNQFVWQKSFYDHVIRRKKSLEKIREYIHSNPLKWKDDEYNREIG